MTFITFVQTIHCRQIESSITTIFCFGTYGDGGKCNFGDWLQFAVNRYDDWIGAEFFVHFKYGPTAQAYAQRECQNPPCSVPPKHNKCYVIENLMIYDGGRSDVRIRTNTYLSIQWRLPSTKYRTPWMVLFIMYSMSRGHADFSFIVDTKNQFTINNSPSETETNAPDINVYALTCLMVFASSLSLSSLLSLRFLPFFFGSCNFWCKTVADITASSSGWLCVIK